MTRREDAYSSDVTGSPMRSHVLPLLMCGLVLVGPAACAGRSVAHVAPDESRPHITWEIRTGGAGSDEVFVCGSSQPTRRCVLPASTDKTRQMATARLYLHAAANETNYLGFMRAPFIRGLRQEKAGEISATVRPGSKPIASTVLGLVTSEAGDYTFSVSVEALQPGLSTPQRIAEDVPVLVK
jgi:hypothetical protein